MHIQIFLDQWVIRKDHASSLREIDIYKIFQNFKKMLSNLKCFKNLFVYMLFKFIHSFIMFILLVYVYTICLYVQIDEYIANEVTNTSKT